MFMQAQEISDKMLSDFQQKFKSDKELSALQNAISANKISSLVQNRSNLIASTGDSYFKYKVSTQGLTNQHSSGRCWLFTGLNVLRPIAAANMNKSEMKFSQAYLFFYDQLEKANLFLEGIIQTREKAMDDKRVEWLFKNVIGDGGQWTGLVDLVQKYGLVPDDVMPESYNADNTSQMSKVLRNYLKAKALHLRKMHKEGKTEKEMRSEKAQVLSDVYKILALTLGEPPQEFSWRYKDKDGKLTEKMEYTPKSFYEKWINVNLNDYVMLMNDPTRPFDKLYEIDYDRHMFEGGNWKYINLETAAIKKMALASIKGNDAMYFSCDVGKQLDMDRGVLDVNNFNYAALFQIDMAMDKTQRIQTFTSGSTHGMTLVAVDVDANENTTQWLLENSWGTRGFNGHLIMTDQWFDEYMFRLVVHKKYVPDNVLKILKSEATLLPPWDPMFSNEL